MRSPTWASLSPARTPGLAAYHIGSQVATVAFVPASGLAQTAIAQVFVPDLSGTALDYTVLYLQILAYGYWALGAIYTVEAGFNGAGNTDVSMYSTLTQYWAVRIPVALVGASVLDLGVAAVFWGVTLSNVAAALWLAGYFRVSTDRGMLARAAEDATASD